jgi:hypothetical protein
MLAIFNILETKKLNIQKREGGTHLKSAGRTTSCKCLLVVSDLHIPLGRCVVLF